MIRESTSEPAFAMKLPLLMHFPVSTAPPTSCGPYGPRELPYLGDDEACVGVLIEQRVELPDSLCVRVDHDTAVLEQDQQLGEVDALVQMDQRRVHRAPRVMRTDERLYASLVPEHLRPLGVHGADPLRVRPKVHRGLVELLHPDLVHDPLAHSSFFLFVFFSR